MISGMSDLDRPDADLRLDCQTCVAANTTACNDCVVSHVLANDDGPIELVTTGVVVELGRAAERASPDDAVGEAVDLLGKAGLLDDPPVWVDRAEFDRVVAVPVS